MENLKKYLNDLIDSLEEAKEIKQRVRDLFSVYPFNEYEYIISILLGKNQLSLKDYFDLRDEYIARNMYLHLFEISAPRGFGELWAQGHLKELVPELVKPSRKIDPDYSGQYDFYLDGKIRIEVKASRAVSFRDHQPLYVKALASDSAKDFDMNFQQVKCECCSVMVWIGVWRDVIRYWVLASNEVLENKYFSQKQHRGNIGEGQLHLRRDNIREFENYEVKSSDLLKAIRGAYRRQVTV